MENIESVPSIKNQPDEDLRGRVFEVLESITTRLEAFSDLSKPISLEDKKFFIHHLRKILGLLKTIIINNTSGTGVKEYTQSLFDLKDEDSTISRLPEPLGSSLYFPLYSTTKQLALEIQLIEDCSVRQYNPRLPSSEKVEVNAILLRVVDIVNTIKNLALD